jgi:hypothetical protein
MPIHKQIGKKMETTEKKQDQENSLSPELTIVDLQNLRTVIDLAARRGAFGGAELTSVGTVFNKLDAFLNAVTAQNPGTEQKTEQPAQ